MELKVALTLGTEVQSKGQLINELFSEINEFVQNRNFGNGTSEYLIICYIINPPKGYEHLFVEFKPKFIEYKSLTNKLTEESFVIERQFSYRMKIDGEKFDKFVNASVENSRKLLSSEILKSLSNLNALPGKVKDFDKERFRADIALFFRENNLI